MKRACDTGCWLVFCPTDSSDFCSLHFAGVLICNVLDALAALRRERTPTDLLQVLLGQLVTLSSALKRGDGLQVLQQAMCHKEALGILASTRPQGTRRIGIASGNSQNDPQVLQEEVRVLRQRVCELGDELASVYRAYEGAISELRRCRDGALDLQETVRSFLKSFDAFNLP